MCFVLDANAYSAFFSKPISPEFAPLARWLYDERETCLVIGGSGYRKELDRLKNYLVYVVNLKRSGKLFEVSDDVVDCETKRVEELVASKKFDDPHIVGLFCASGCQLFASCDKRADQYIKDKDLYHKNQKPPKIYRSAKDHTHLLCASNIVKLRNPKAGPSD